LGTFAGARSCDRAAGAPGIFPLDPQVNLPERCDADVLPAWMTRFEVAPPGKASAGVFEPLLDRDLAESGLLAGAQAAPAADAACGAVVKHRMEGAGTRWSLAGAEAMLALRALQKSHDHARRASWRFLARQA
jgi:hypothetical protein